MYSSKENHSRVLLLLLTLSLMAYGCGDDDDNATGPEDPDPPELPSFSGIQPDTDFFSANTEDTSQSDVYYEAWIFIENTAEPLLAIRTFADPFIERAMEEGYEDYEDGVYVWIFAHSEQGEDYEVRLEAEDNGPEIGWELYISTEDGDLDDMRFMNGTTSEDGSQGEWNIYDFESDADNALMTYDWALDEEDNLSISYLIFDSESDLENYVSMEYEENADEHVLFIESEEDDYEYEVGWNETTNEGYVNSSGDVRCWDENFEETDC